MSESKTRYTEGLESSIRSCRIPDDIPLAEIDRYLVPDADRIAKRIFELPESAWRKWKTDPPSLEDGEIVGRDALGYCHLATHMIGATDPFCWVEDWTPLFPKS
jgi:hypothetical protein